MIYQGAYKCELCGKIFFAGETYNDTMVSVPDHASVSTFAWHHCDNGNIGAGKAIGLMKREDLIGD